MDTLLQDVKYAIRTLRRSPGFTSAAVLTLALGIGANTAIFSVVDGVLLRPAPFTDMDRLTMIWETDRKSSTFREPASVPDFLDFVERSRAYQQIAAFVGMEMSLTPDRGDPSRLAVMAVSGNFLPLVGIQPLVGRTFTGEDDRVGGPANVLISEGLWERQFSRDPSVVGRTIRLDDSLQTIIGVLPAEADFGSLQILRSASYGRGFADRGGRRSVDVWLPLQPDPRNLPRSTHPILLIGRLAPGATAAGAQQEMTAIAADLERTYPVNDARGVNVEALSAVVFGPVRPALFTLLGAVALVLLIACANVANLMLVRGTGRVPEVTVRTALGAGSSRLARQFAVEGAVLTAAGAGLGILLAVTGLDFMLSFAPASIPRVGSVGLNGTVLLVTLAISILVGLVFGFLPTLQARRLNLQAALKDEGSRGASSGREHRRFRSALVVTELAFAVMLMIGAGLLIRSLWRLQQVDPGFSAAGVVKADYQLPASRYPRDFSVWPRWPATFQFNDELRRRAASLPGATQAGIASNHPLDAGFQSSIQVVGREAEAADWPEPVIRLVTPGYFETLSVALTDGRRLQESDDINAPAVIVINEAARRTFFANRPPLGQRISLWGAQRTVVGVVGNEHFRGLDADVPPAVYLPAGQVPSAAGTYSIVVRTSASAATVVPSLRAMFRELDPGLALYGVEALSTTVANSVGQRRFTMLLLGVFAAVALLLAVVGVHGVLSYSVAQRTRELGIRMALGANESSIRTLVLRQGTALVAGGVVLGLIGAVALTRAIGSLLYGVRPGDPVTFGVVALGLAAVGLIASYLPARRAMRVEPVVALRNE